MPRQLIRIEVQKLANAQVIKIEKEDRKVILALAKDLVDYLAFHGYTEVTIKVKR